MARLEDIYQEDKILRLKLKKTTYYKYISSNFFCDVILPSSDKGTIRDIVEPGPYLTTLCDSLSSNHLGINCALITKDNFIITPKKSKEVIHDPNTLEISVSGSCKWRAGGRSNFMREAVLSETSDELGIKDDRLNEIFLLAVLRDLRKLGKPEAFFCSRTSITLERARELHTAKVARSHWEFSSISGIPVSAGSLLPRRVQECEDASPNLQAFSVLVARTPDAWKEIWRQ
jgi:hypothetical protein